MFIFDESNCSVIIFLIYLRGQKRKIDIFAIGAIALRYYWFFVLGANQLIRSYFRDHIIIGN